MKRLIVAADVLKAHSENKSLFIDENTIVTASARDVAKEKGVSLITVKDINEEKCEEKACRDQKHCDVKKEDCKHEEIEIIEIAKGDHCKIDHCEKEENTPVLSEEEIYKVFKAAINCGLFTEEGLLDRIKGIM